MSQQNLSSPVGVAPAGPSPAGVPVPRPIVPPAGPPTRADLSKAGFRGRREARAACPFRAPSLNGTDRRLKILLWGPTGTLKTRTAIAFPSPAVIDLERGTDMYREEFKFQTLPPATPDEIIAAVHWLAENEHAFRTIVIDPISRYWAALQRKWERIFRERLGGREGHKVDFFEIGPKEWNVIKAEFQELVEALFRADLNVVVTAHDKPQYSDAAGAFLRKIGETADAEKNFERVFDVILRCERTEGPDGRKFHATTLKDRTNRLPGRFELRYEDLASFLGVHALERAARPRKRPTEVQLARISALVEQLGISQAAVSERLAAFGSSTFDDLDLEQAAAVLDRLEARAAKQSARAAQQDARGEEVKIVPNHPTATQAEVLSTSANPTP